MTEHTRNKQETTDSVTRVNFCEVKDIKLTSVKQKLTSGFGCWNNPRKTVGVKVDSGLYLAFKPVAVRKFGSVCKAVEAFMATVLACNQIGVNFGNTIRIDSLKVERNLSKERRNLTFIQCQRGSCRKKAQFLVTYKDVKYYMCDQHQLEYRGYKGTGNIAPLEA